MGADIIAGIMFGMIVRDLIAMKHGWIIGKAVPWVGGKFGLK